MSLVKCPNPGCPYQFDPARVPAGVALTCPRCATTFTLGPPAAGGPADLDFGPDPAGGRHRSGGRGQPPGSGVRQTVVLAVVGLALLAAVGATVYFRLFHRPARDDRDSAAVELRDKDLAFDPPGPPWVRDDALVNRLGSPYLMAFRRDDGDAATDTCLAFGARDFATREPRPGELREGLLGPLERVLDDIRAGELDGARWLGRPAAGLEFRARLKHDGSVVEGRCFAVGYKGVGYWLVGWAAEAAAADRLTEVDGIRGTFRLLGGRAKWSPREAAARSYTGRKGAYQVIDADGAWAEPDPAVRPPTDLDPRADLLLVSKEKRPGRDFVDEATFLVAVVPGPADDPLAVGRKHVEGRRTAEVAEMAPGVTPTFADRPTAPDEEAVPPAAGEAVPVVRLRSSVPGDPNQSRLVVVAAVPVGDQVAVGYGYCAWADRQLFEARLVRLTGSLRERK